MKGPGAVAGSSMAAPLSRAYDDPSSLEIIEDTTVGRNLNLGKPLTTVADAKKKIFSGSSGSSKMALTKPGYTWSAQQGLPGTLICY